MGEYWKAPVYYLGTSCSCWDIFPPIPTHLSILYLDSPEMPHLYIHRNYCSSLGKVEAIHQQALGAASSLFCQQSIFCSVAVSYNSGRKQTQSTGSQASFTNALNAPSNISMLTDYLQVFEGRKGQPRAHIHQTLHLRGQLLNSEPGAMVPFNASSEMHWRNPRPI